MEENLAYETLVTVDDDGNAVVDVPEEVLGDLKTIAKMQWQIVRPDTIILTVIRHDQKSSSN